MLFAAKWMDLEIIILSEVSQREKDKYQYDITHMWNQKNGTNEIIQKSEVDSQTQKINYGYQRGRGMGGRNQEFGINRYTPLYIK